MLSADLIKQLKEKLEAKKQDLTKELLSFASKNSEIPGDFSTVFPKYGEDEDDNAQEITTYENMLPIEHALEGDLVKVNKALERIKGKQYGVCENCGQSIDIKRLEAYPEAELCIQCAKNKS